MASSARALMKHSIVLKGITPFDYDFVFDSQFKRISFADLLNYLQNKRSKKRDVFITSCSLIDVYELIKRYSLVKQYDYNFIENCTYSDTHHSFSKKENTFVICKKSVYGNSCYNLNVRNCYVQAIVDPKSTIYKQSLNLANLKDIDSSKLVFFDIETTGLNEFEDDVLEIAFYDIESKLAFCKRLPLRKRKEIPENISEINHITKEMVKDALPLNQSDIEQLIKTFKFEEKYIAIWTGNNLFDAAFLKIYFIDNNLHSFESFRFINVKSLIKEKCELLLNDYSKDHIASLYGISIENAHNALEDCKIEAEIFSRVFDDRNNKTDK